MKNAKKLLCLFLTLVMLAGLLPTSILADGTPPTGLRSAVESGRDITKAQVRVIVENTTYTEGAAWHGRLIDEWVEINSESTMMGCVVTALENHGYTQEGAESGYITSIAGVSAGDENMMAGWMGTLNDWFTNEGFSAFTVADKTLAAGDVIDLMYSCDMGVDCGGTWENNDKSLKTLSFSAGTLNTAFASAITSYTLTVPYGTTDVYVTPTATNKNFQVRTSVGATEYKRTAAVPVEDGTVITVKCGDPAWLSMNGGNYGTADSVPAEAYTVTVAVAPDTSAAQTVIDLIAAIGAVTLESEDEITAARTAYHALSDEQKAYVTNFNVLTAAETELAALKNPPANPVTVTVKVAPSSVNVAFYSDAAATAAIASSAVKDDGTVGKYRQYTLTVAPGTYSYRGTDGETSLGGEVFTVTETETQTFNLLRTNIRYNGTTLSAEGDYSFTLKNGMNDVVCGTPYLSSNIRYSPTLLIAGTAHTGTVTLAEIFLEDYYVSGTISNSPNKNATTAATYNLPIAAYKIIRVTAPSDAETTFYQQNKNFNVSAKTPDDTKDNGNGTNTYIFKSKSAHSNFSYRSVKNGKVTQAGYLADGNDLTVTFPEGRTPSDRTNSVNYDDNGVLLNINSQNKLTLGVGDTFKLRAYRAAWQIINTQTTNIMIEPDFHFAVLSGSDVIDIEATNQSDAAACSGNAAGNWMQITAKKAGTAIVAVYYDAIDVYGANPSNASGITGFGATDPARYGVFTVCVGDTGTVTWNPVSESGTWDAEFDTVSYTGESGVFSFKPTEDATSVTVQNVRGTVLGTAQTVTADAGTYNVPVTDGANIITVTAAAGTDTMVVRAKKVAVTITNNTTKKTNADEDFVIRQGDNITIGFDHLEMPVPKFSGIYNPGYMGTIFTKYTLNGEYDLLSSGTQYDYAVKNSITFDAMIVGENTLTHGTTNVMNMGSAFGEHRKLTDTGVPANTNASSSAPANFGTLPDITFTVTEEGGSRPTGDYTKLKALSLYVGQSTFMVGIDKAITDANGNVVTNWKNPTAAMGLHVTATTTSYLSKVQLRYWYAGEEPRTVKLTSGVETTLSGSNFSADGNKLLNIQIIVTAPNGGAKAYNYVVLGGTGNLKYVHPLLKSLTVKVGETPLTLTPAIDCIDTEYSVFVGDATTIDLSGVQQIKVYNTAATADQSDQVKLTKLKNGEPVGETITVLESGLANNPNRDWSHSNLDISDADALELTVTSYADSSIKHSYHISLVTTADMNKTVAQTVIDLIAAIGAVTLESEDKITAARTAYHALSDEQKAYVTNFNVLTAAEAAIKALKAVPAGAGTAEAPYLLQTADNLVWVSDLVKSGNNCTNTYFRMENDITLPADWFPIGGLKSGDTGYSYRKTGLIEAIYPFNGIIDGGNHTLTVPVGSLPLLGGGSFTVKNLKIYGEKIPSYGLAAYYRTGHTVTIENVTVLSGSHILKSGLLGGYGNKSESVIRGCTVQSGVVIGDDGTWGSFGYDGSKELTYSFGPANVTENDMIGSVAGSFNGTVTGCISAAAVYGHNYVGGIVGFKGQSMQECIINDCVFTGSVIASGEGIGGILGSGYAADSAPNTPCATVENCLVTGSVTGVTKVGGIFGGELGCAENWGNGIGRIRNNVFSGTVSATAQDGIVGGIVGYMNSFDLYNLISGNYYINTVSKGIGQINGIILRDETDAGRNYGRLDDPADTDTLNTYTAAVSAAELSDGTVLALLTANKAGNSWVAGEATPVLNTAAHITGVVSKSVLEKKPVIRLNQDNYSELLGKNIQVSYSDGRTRVNVSAAALSFYGVDFTKSGIQLCSADYENYQFTFGVEVTTSAAVMGLIDAIGTVTENSGSAIYAARTAYDALTTADRTKVTNHAVLTDAEAAFAEYSPVCEIRVTVSSRGVLGKANDNSFMAYRPVTVTDLDLDGKLTVHEALAAAHKAYLTEAGYMAENGTYGLSVTKLWGVETYNTLFFVNGSGLSVGVGTDTVKNGDRLLISVNSDDTNYADWFTCFTENSVGTVAGTAASLQIKGYLGMAYAPTAAPIAGLTVKTADGTVLGTTDADGRVSVSFANAGSYLVTASGTVTAMIDTDWDGIEDTHAVCPIIAPACTVTVTERPQEQVQKITVSFTLLGDDLHGELTAAAGTHTLKSNNLKTWISRTSYSVAAGATVRDVLELALSDHNMTCANPGGNYVQSVTRGGVTLGEFDNGNLSGWMYTLNGTHPALGVSEQHLSDGDSIVFHYTDDYTKEQGSEVWSGTNETEQNGEKKDATNEGTSVIETKVNVSGDTATAAVSQQTVTASIAELKKSGGSAIRVDVRDAGTAGAVAVELPTSAIRDIVNDTNAALNVQTDMGSLRIPNDTLAEIVRAAGGTNVSMHVEKVDAAEIRSKLPEGAETEKALAVSFSITSGGKTISSFGGKALEVSFPVDTGVYEEGKSYVVYIVSDDGSITQTTAAIKNGEAVVSTTHFSTVVVTKEEVKAPFADIVGYWAEDAIRYVYANRLMSGVGGDKFDPEGTLSRAMLVTALYRLAGEPAVNDANPFSDVKNGRWYTNAIIWAAENKLVNGYGSGKFGPEDNITREQMAKILHAYAKFSGYDTAKTNDLKEFTDVSKISSWALDAVKWANAMNLINGRTAATIVPGGNATRAEAASVLMRYLKNAVK